jgi:hypothetical protein
MSRRPLYFLFNSVVIRVVIRNQVPSSVGRALDRTNLF